MLPRTLFYALLAINIVLALLFSLAFFGYLPLGKASEGPERLSKQIAPEMIRVLPAHASSASSVASAAPVEASAPEASTSAPEAQDAERVAAQSLSSQENKKKEQEKEKDAEDEDKARCVALKGLQEDLADDISARARKFSKLKLSSTSAPGSVSYWVSIPPEGGKEGAERRVEALDSNGITDRFIVRGEGENQHAISLGLYHSEELAKRRLDALQKAGIKNARVTRREANIQRLEIKGPKKAIDAFLATLPAQNKGKPLARQACQAN